MRTKKQVAADAWWCEGCWQPEGQLDIWQGIDEVVLDADLDDEDDDIEMTGTDEQQ